MGRTAALAVAVALIASTAACAHSRPELFGERLPASCKDGSVSVEQCAGWLIDVLQVLVHQVPYNDEQLAAYVSGVGDRLVRAHGDRRTWRFVVVDDEEVQATAGMSSTVSIYRGAIAALRDEAELAGLLGHEIAHVLGGHMHENLQDILSDVGRGAEAERHADRYARDDEIQADEAAVVLLAKAGYDPRGVERMLRAFATTSPNDGADPTSHHPTWAERIARVQALAEAYATGETGEQRFRARVASLVVGDDPRVSTVVGRAAVFAHAGFAVDLPPYRAIDAGASSVTLRLPDETGIDLRALAPELARMLKSTPAGGTRFEVVDGKRLSLVITVVGPDAALVARHLKSIVRAPRPDELRAIRPKYVDLDEPRVLWHP